MEELKARMGECEKQATGRTGGPDQKIGNKTREK